MLNHPFNLPLQQFPSADMGEWPTKIISLYFSIPHMYERSNSWMAVNAACNKQQQQQLKCKGATQAHEVRITLGAFHTSPPPPFSLHVVLCYVTPFKLFLLRQAEWWKTGNIRFVLHCFGSLGISNIVHEREVWLLQMYIRAFFILYTQPAGKKDLKARETGSGSSLKRGGVKVWIVKLSKSKRRQGRLLSSATMCHK